MTWPGLVRRGGYEADAKPTGRADDRRILGEAGGALSKLARLARIAGARLRAAVAGNEPTAERTAAKSGVEYADGALRDKHARAARDGARGKIIAAARVVGRGVRYFWEARDMNTEPKTPAGPVPTNDSLMHLLASIPEDYSWMDFKPILYDPAKLEAWLAKELARPEPDRYLDPEDPAAVEASEASAETESAALEFLNELTPEEQEMIEEAMRALWGREGAALMPVRISQRTRGRRE